MGGNSGLPAVDGQEPQGTWETLRIEGGGWRDPNFTLDSSEDEDEPLLTPPPAGAAATPTTVSSNACQQQLQRSASKFQVTTENGAEGWQIYRHEALRITSLAGPIVASSFMNFALNLVSVAFIGRLSEERMAIAVLATSFMSVTGFSVVLGLLGALDTLGGQAWGAKNYKALGITLQKALITILVTTTAICMLWANVESIMLAVGQEEAIAQGTARYLLLTMPALLATGMSECLKRYLMVQGVVQPVTVVSCLVLCLAPLLNWLFIFKLGGGIDGAALAMVACNGAMLAMLLAFVVWHEGRRLGTPQQTWHGWSRDCLRGLGTYYKLALPSTLMVCLEWWAYEFCIFMAGWLPQPTLHVAAMGVLMQVSGMAYMLPMGVSCATSVRVSNALGAGLPHGARRSAHTATAITTVTQALLVTTILLARNKLGAFFTNIPEVAAVCSATFPLMSASMAGDGLNCVISGLLRGAGRQELGALLNLGSYWGLGLPTAYLLAVKAGFELKGLWGGLILATSVQGSIMLVVLARFNWQREAERAAELVAANSGCNANRGSCGLLCEDSAAKLHPGRRAGGLGSHEGRDGIGSSPDVEGQ